MSKNMNIMPTVFSNEQELFKAVITLHCPEYIELDPMYSKGHFYLEIPKPKLRFDISPQADDCRQADAQDLPIVSNTIQTMILDPPFCFGGKNGPHGGQGKDRIGKQTTEIRFGFLWNFEALEELYRNILKEAYRVLKPKGILIFKCQDYTDTKTTMTHCFVWQWAIEQGFYPKDLAILNKPNKWYVKSRQQRHLRKTHSYFWVLEKKIK